MARGSNIPSIEPIFKLNISEFNKKLPVDYLNTKKYDSDYDSTNHVILWLDIVYP